MNTNQRKLLQVWVKPEGIEKIEALAHDLGVTKAEVVRQCLTVALADPGKIVDRIERRKGDL